MSQGMDFLLAIGLSQQVSAWLKKNVDHPLREEIIKKFMEALSNGYPKESVDNLRNMIARIPDNGETKWKT